ncbi:hypothetical protein AUK11_00175 [bacterium CG2_30_37_16]|nr:MAG: hypothetical protein AUK11_00175 [bacterium CG2_30_37_16]PIP30637.1 MAG: hypothetical protein COX25_03540 [bacterium (Candidatus Howlettbacteria) CG23_combo_of_CG06-09_8_20_14_all_37_9]PIY00067.1 MAG: hypothetical protein COZ22_01210 [bacterium (Candidatus Howlettbacteria) CG_4_10_14_3_um_filter_37_10]PJB05381.1 MAG: hypothetical protein CO123_04165 [bacterium (Candidatus Howlettbacteria) CG_4_9_14_3_um_filter_37_10]
MKKLLLHTCCGPCLMYPGTKLREKFEVSVFYFNPNIHPDLEYKERLKNAKIVSKSLGFKFVEGEYRPKTYFKKLQKNPQASRCENCYQIRLEETAKKAGKDNFSHFSTTLLVSPYQNRELIIRIGNEIGLKYGVKFVDEDFRPGFKEGREMAKDLNLYLQNFCGCSFSFVEKFNWSEPCKGRTLTRGNGGSGSV